MKSQYMKSLSLSRSKVALLIVLLALSCGNLTTAQAGGREPLFVGLVDPGTRDHGAALAGGYLLVYSATDASTDGELVFNAHSSYLIYTTDGKLFKRVENHMSRSDEISELVSLPAGFYVVEARSANDGYVRVSVVIKPNRRTLVDLDR
jgi:hypothetical protein